VGLREAAHRLCGMVAAASSTLGQVASEVENAAATGQLAEAGVLLRRLGDMTPAMLRELACVSLEGFHGLSAECA